MSEHYLVLPKRQEIRGGPTRPRGSGGAKDI